MLSMFRGELRVPLRTLVVFTALAVTAALAQAASASASVYIYAPGAPDQPPAKVFNAAGCGNPANIVQWNLDSSSNCNGTGSNELWTITKFGVDYGVDEIESFTAHYGDHSMCLNVKGADYAEGTPIIAYNCDGGVTLNEKFVVEPNADIGGADLTPYGGATGKECFNIWGGFGNGNQIKLYPCQVGAANEDFNTN